MTTQNNPKLDFYLQVEDFVLNATVAEGRYTALDNEIRLFLLTLLNHHKQQEMTE